MQAVLGSVRRVLLKDIAIGYPKSLDSILWHNVHAVVATSVLVGSVSGFDISDHCGWKVGGV